jgi:predicted metallo-beta-lactamase superfamily hydrolase
LGLNNLKKIIKHVPVTIFDHHILRDKNWKKKCHELFKIAKKTKHKMKTAAEYLSLENKLYEANRKELYIKQPPSSEYKKWINKVENGKISIRPPIK